MSEFKKVETKEDLELLNQDEILDGYRSGLAGAAEPGSAHSRSYWHGWRNGRVDGGFNQPDVEMARLVYKVVGNGCSGH